MVKSRDFSLARSFCHRTACHGPLLVLALALMLAACTPPSAALYSLDDQRLMVYASSDTKMAVQEAHRHGSVDEAIRLLRLQLKKNPRDIKTMLTLSRLYLINRELDKAETQATKVKQVNYRDRPAKVLLANIAFIRGHYEEAKLILEQLGGERSPEPDVLLLLAGVALHQGDDDTSIKILKSAIKRSPTYIAAHMNVGLIYLRHQEFSSAEDHFKRVLEVLPGNREARLHLGITYAALGQMEAAEDVYRSLLRANSDDPYVLFNMAVLKFRQKDYKKTLSYLKDYVDKSPRRYIARRAATDIINEIQLDKVRRGGLSDDDIEELAERLNDSEESAKPLSMDKNAELSSGFVFTSVGYIPD